MSRSRRNPKLRRICKRCKKTRVHHGMTSAMCAACRYVLVRYRDSDTYLRSLISGARSRAKRKGFDFDLDSQWAVDEFRKNQGLCEATGVPLEIPKRRRSKARKGIPVHSPSIDRIDSNQGYLKTNCRIVSVIFNSMKGPYSDEVILFLCKAFIETYRINEGKTRKRG